MQGLDRIAFICGCGHSGTTLLATILSVHPAIHVPLYESEAFLGTDAVASERMEGLRQRAVESGKRILVEKTPRHVRHIPRMRRMVPGSRFILMVRDGRDVTASIANRTGGDYELGLRRWVRDTGLVLKERGKADSLVVRYEDVVADPAREIRRVCQFLDVDYSDDLLEYHKARPLWFGKSDVRPSSGVGYENHTDLRNWQVNQPIFDGRGRWERDLPPAMIARFKWGRPAKLMAEFGYAPAVSWWRRLVA